MNYLVYILQCKDGSYYTGITNDLEKRLRIHALGKGSKYVRARLPFKLVFQEEQITKSLAMKREFEIKKMRKRDKIKLVKS
ncbi:GIY-YIG nuclease family protein [Candidatus Dojkabacteria bacterium]|nr:GIY-YIG nuclease family protein [Candidatus Dojkabacteria bacterium]